MVLVNQIEEIKRNEIINLLKDKSLGITLSNEPECLDLYYQTFKNLKRICKGKKRILFQIILIYKKIYK